MMPQLKPEVCIINDHLALFIGADYKLMPVDAADAYIRKMQGTLAKLRRKMKADARKVKRAHG
jgi:hypothetical protein